MEIDQETKPPLPPQITVGVSSCLLGEKVRHDGRHKREAFIREFPSLRMTYGSLCPEVLAGFGVPRPAITLARRGNLTSAVDSEGDDVTDPLRDASRRILGERDVSGYLLKSGSPSCGIEDVAVEGGATSGPGLFVRTLMVQEPHLPMIDEVAFKDQKTRIPFFERVVATAGWRQLVESAPAPELGRYHRLFTLGWEKFRPRDKEELQALVAQCRVAARQEDPKTRAILLQYRERFDSAILNATPPTADRLDGWKSAFEKSRTEEEAAREIAAFEGGKKNFLDTYYTLIVLYDGKGG